VRRDTAPPLDDREAGMFYEEGCHGRVLVGTLPAEVGRRLCALPGEWLEFDQRAGAIVVRHIQPTAGPTLPTIAGELVRMIAEIPVEAHEGIVGGELLVHTEDTPHLVRIRVEPGGAIRLDWAQPDFDTARKRPYSETTAIPIEGVYCRLNGSITLAAADAEAAARKLQLAADTYEGLYPEGDFQAVTESGSVRVTMRDVNLDPRLLVARLDALAARGSLRGTVDVSSFDDRRPDDRFRILFQEGTAWVQEPYLWPEMPTA
jgi:hypothetical protein